VARGQLVLAGLRGRVQFIALNDTPEEADFSLRILAVSTAGEVREIGQAKGSSQANAVAHLTSITSDVLNANEVLCFEWNARDQSGLEHVMLTPYKVLPLQNPAIALDVHPVGTDWEVTLRAHALALYVALEADVPGRFSDNAVTLTPDQQIKITFTPDAHVAIFLSTLFVP